MHTRQLTHSSSPCSSSISISISLRVSSVRKLMDIQALNRNLLDRIQSLEEQGLIDSHLRICYSLKEDSGIYFFADLVTIFFSDVRTVLNNMTITLHQPIMNYKELDEYCVKLLGSAACIGACRLRRSCSKFRKAIDLESKEGCTSGLIEIKEEFNALQIHLESILQLERSIVSKTRTL